ncbi:MAG: SWIM zinc finger family protein [Nitrososphaera sp.]
MSCECPDFLKRKAPCKHIHAVSFMLRLGDIASANGIGYPSRSPSTGADMD